MFFTTAGRVIAWLAVALGMGQVGLGLIVASSDNPALAAKRYLGSEYSGVAIDEGMLSIALGIALGILTDISRSVARKYSKPTDKE